MSTSDDAKWKDLEAVVSGAHGRAEDEWRGLEPTSNEDDVLAGFRAQLAEAAEGESPLPTHAAWHASPALRSFLAVAALILAVLGIIVPMGQNTGQSLGPGTDGEEIQVQAYDDLSWDHVLSPACWYRLEFFHPEMDTPFLTVQEWEQSSHPWPEEASDRLRLVVTVVDPTGVEDVVADHRYLRLP